MFLPLGRNWWFLCSRGLGWPWLPAPRTRAVVQRELAGAISLAWGAGNSWIHLAVAGLPAEGAGMSRRACALRRKGSRPQPPCSRAPQGELARATTEH